MTVQRCRSLKSVPFEYRETALADPAALPSDELIDVLLDTMPVPMLRLDANGITRHANPALEDLIHLSRAELVGRPYDQPPVTVATPDGEALDFQSSPVPRALRGERVEAYEAAVHLPGQQDPRILCFDAAPYHDAAGGVAGVMLAVRDLSEQHRSRDALRTSERRLHSILDNTRMAVFVMNELHHCIYCNAAAEELTGYRLEDMQGRPLHDVVHHTHPDGRPYPLEECPIDRAFPEDFQVEGEETFVHRDGSFYPVAFTASPIRDGASRTIGTVIEARGIAHEKQRESEREESQRRLFETQERYRLALLATNDAIWDWDLRSNQVLWNEALQATYGWLPHQVAPTGQWWLDQIHPEDRERIGSTIHAVIDGTGGEWSQEYRFRRANGSYANVFDRGTVLRDAAGCAVRMIGAMLDQTEQKRQQAALRDSELMLRNLTEAMPNMAWITDGAGAVEWFNGVWYEYVGSPRGSDLGHAWAAYLHPEDRDDAVRKWSVASGQAKAFANEHRFRSGSGAYRWFLARATPILDAQGAIGRWFGTCTDIQELVEARNVLNRSREDLAREVEARGRELDRIWNISEDLFVVCDADLGCRNVNPAWRELLGYEAVDLIGRRLSAVVDPRDVPKLQEVVDALRRVGSVRDVDLRIQHRSGAVRTTTWNWRAEADVLYASGRDVTQRMELERQLRHAQKMETVGKLTGGVAHDFNNLLQVVSGNLQLLSRLVVGNPAAEARVQNALAGVGRGAKLASQLLAFGRKQPLEPKVVHVGRLVLGMEDMLRRTLGDAVEVETVVSGGLWNALIDPAQLENAVLNLAINARDAMDGSGQLTIEAGNAYLDDAYVRQHEEVQPGQYVVVAVTDTGCGMAPEVLAQVFEPFFSTKPEGKGTGLGLSMVYGFVKQSGGHVKMYSEPGQGTTVKLYLPRSTAMADDVVAATTGPVKGGTETILVAEDDDEVRATAVDMLATLGYRVLKARDAASALSIIESGIPIDLLFTDVVMPGTLRSPELARKAKERLPGLAVLFTSGYTENAIVHAGRLDPGVELLGKPYTQEALGRKVRHVLGNQQQRNQAVAGLEAKQAIADARDGARYRLLLVEDDELIRSNTAELLQSEGHHVVAAATAREAVAALHKGMFDVLITDLGLPDRRGEDLAAEARQMRPDLALVFATGSDEPGLPGEDAVLLVKPYDMAALGNSVREAVNGARRKAAREAAGVGDTGRATD